MRRCSLLLILLVSGCASLDGHDPDRYVRDGQEFGVVDGTFRGRWWNFYARGKSFLDGGFYAEAEADLRKALAHRAQDQRWARTYGLHFTPEYFPNRELGITLFHQGDYAAAQQRLEASLDQSYSALAAHYLDEVRREQVRQSGDDGAGPEIVPADARTQAPLSEMVVPFKVTIRDDQYVARVTVDGTPWQLPQSSQVVHVRTDLPLRAGVNTVEVVAEDLLGNRTVADIPVLSDHDGPAVSFEGNSATDRTILGRAYDPAGISVIKVAGTEVSFEETPDGSVRFQVPWSGAANITFDAADALGNRTAGVVPVTAGPLETAAVVSRRTHFAAAISPAQVHEYLPIRYAAKSGGPELRLTNIVDGQRYLMDEIVVTISVRAEAPLAALSLNGRALDGLVPGARQQQVSRRVRLDHPGENTLVVEARLEDGSTRRIDATVARVLNEVERIEARLRVALLGNLWEGAAPRLQDEANFIVEELGRGIFDRGRFDLISRDALPRVLQEQELKTVLGSRDLGEGLRQIVPADLLAVGKVRRTGDTVEVILQAVSAETSAVLGYADVAGRATTLEELRMLVQDLAIRFEQEFPRVQGLVVDVPSDTRCFSSLTTADRVRADLPCVVFRYGPPIVHPETGAELGRPVDVVAEGYLREVRTGLSRIALTPTEQAAESVQVNDHVLTK